MRIRSYVSASVAVLVAVSPLPALAGAVVTASVSPTADVAAGAKVSLTCWSEGQPVGGMGSSTTTSTSWTSR